MVFENEISFTKHSTITKKHNFTLCLSRNTITRTLQNLGRFARYLDGEKGYLKSEELTRFNLGYDFDDFNFRLPK